MGHMGDPSGLSPALKVCGCPNSQQQHPTLPNCTCNAENWDASLVACDPGSGVAVELGLDHTGAATARQPLDFADSRTWPVQQRFEVQHA